MIEVSPDLDLEQAIKYLLSFKKVAEYPRKIQALKAIEVPNSSAETYRLINTLKLYADDLSVYERLHQEALTLDKAYALGNADIECQVEKLMWDRSGLIVLDISVEQKQKIWNKAVYDGHAHGYIEIYCVLCGLVELFK